MKAYVSYFFALSIMMSLLAVSAQLAVAQQSDTTQTRKELRQKKETISQPYHSERSHKKQLVPESDRYGVPEPTEYYQPPFMGQKYLDRAVAAYRAELKNSVANTPLFKFIGRIAPFITNQFEFSVYQINDLPIVDRDNPYLHPQLDSGESDENKSQK